jgi:hypothetical protein
MYMLGRSALGDMTEIRVTLSNFLKMKSAAIVAALTAASHFLVVEEVNQSIIGWIAAE